MIGNTQSKDSSVWSSGGPGNAACEGWTASAAAGDGATAGAGSSTGWWNDVGDDAPVRRYFKAQLQPPTEGSDDTGNL